ncbi:MAG: HAD family phosphatase [Pirellulales bacterium]|nr:HAD family phosphatase [Pirellulales bacterium]
MRRPRAVVFDLDGLLFNTELLYPIVGEELLRRRGCQITKQLLDEMMGRPARVSLQLMIDRHQLDATVEQLNAESAEIFVELLDTRLAPMPGVVELLAALEAAGIPKAVATSSGRAFVVDVLGRFSWEPRFEFLLTAEDVVQGKPHPEIYLKAASRLGREPADVLVLEDSANGCRAAVAAGTLALAVPGEHSADHDFSGAHLRLETLCDPRLYAVLGLERPAFPARKEAC